MRLKSSCGKVSLHMSKLEKQKERILRRPNDYTYSEARTLLAALGFKEYMKGKTSGSRVIFYRERDQKKILLHKPHPGDIMKIGAVKQLVKTLEEEGDL